MARRYAIPVPYTTSFSDGMKIEMALGMPEVQTALKRLRPALVEKLKRVGPMHHETFSKAELDSIPADLWDRLASHLG
ncbi:hypothetical protein CIW48_27290 [Methylobacterium sp. P1-11]|uniref:hypothetical protein n=1 Tax=Methylobacterium sp. P1-11 TaxID=2024616 RepID=UPI0011EBA803|nr:hypothetical protein [Methylobacterium sp. P1-11]KAA0117907.1 hypothetical protein CIW48_27290 [Methylobacterium sp. P1-11]